MNLTERAWEIARDARDNRRCLERYRPQLRGTAAYQVLLKAERLAVKRAMAQEKVRS